MADQFITELDALTNWDNTDYEVVERDPAGTPETMYMTKANALENLFRRMNYQITRTVASNNVTVAIKDSDGNDATAAKPLYFNIGGYIRKLTASLTVTVNAGAAAGSGTWNLGATEFATLAQDLFVYIGYRASDTSVFVLLARFPTAPSYSYFSATAANEKYGAYSGAAPAAADPVEVIGRANVANSGTASYNWSVPTPNIIIQTKTETSEWNKWTPTQAGYSANPTLTSYYRIERDKLSWAIASGTGTSNATTVTNTLPWTPAGISAFNMFSDGRGQDNGGECSPVFKVTQGNSTMDIYKGPGQTVWTNTGTKFAAGQGFYKMA